MSGPWKNCLCVMGASLLLALSSTSPAAAQDQHEMTFHTVPPCTVVDTRSGGGAFAANEIRNYNVVGNGSFASQGGSSTGCGIPGFSGGVAQVQAVALIVTSINSAGAGYIAINAADQSLAGAVLNPLAGAVITNTGPVAVAQASGSGDIKVQAASFSTDILLRVVGYYSKPVQTVHVHPVPGSSTASGTALTAAIAAITGTSTKRYVVKVEPGIYDVGTTGLTMKPYVDIEGSGEETTVIQGPGSATTATAVVVGASSAELRNLQVKSTASSTDANAVAILLSTDTRISHVTVIASGPSTSNVWGIRVIGSTPVISDTKINVSGGTLNQGFVSRAGAAPRLRDTRITVTGFTNTGYGILVTSSGTMAEMDGLHVEVNGAGTGYAYYQSDAIADAAITDSTLLCTASGTAWGVYYAGVNLRISHSTIRAIGSTSTGVRGGNSTTVDNSEIAGATTTISGGSVGAFVGGSKLDGGATIGTLCAGVWDESYTFYAGSACP